PPSTTALLPYTTLFRSPFAAYNAGRNGRGIGAAGKTLRFPPPPFAQRRGRPGGSAPRTRKTPFSLQELRKPRPGCRPHPNPLPQAGEGAVVADEVRSYRGDAASVISPSSRSTVVA